MTRSSEMRRPRHGRATARALSLALLAALVPAGLASAEAPPRSESVGARSAPAEELDVSLEALPRSVHHDIDCSDCHVGNGGGKLLEEGMVEGEVQCLGCHEGADHAYAGSVHAQARLGGSVTAARCQDCHGAHDVRTTDDPSAHTNARRITETCAACHGDTELAEKLGISDPEAFHTYEESIHGQVLLEKGTTAAPSCVSCHGSHAILGKKNPASPVHEANIARTCGGDCHAGIEQTLQASVHGLMGSSSDPSELPTCLDCHDTHAIEAKGESFKLQTDRLCGDCHEERLADHLGTYHGRAHVLGGADVAACYDCHGAHDMKALDDPESQLSLANRVETCQGCHESAPAGFATYKAHGNPNDRADYPMLHDAAFSIRGVLAVALVLLLLHGLAWLFRSGAGFVRNPRRFLEEHRRRTQERYRNHPDRIQPVDKACHALLLLSFAVLITTGAPLMFHDTSWAQRLFGWLGGADIARAWHRVGALMTLIYVVLHVGTVVARGWRRRHAYRDEHGRLRARLLVAELFGPSSPLPNRHDLRQLLAHAKWFAGRGPAPKVTRYAYWEKLDYLATFFAVAVIGTSGAMIWAPEAVATVLPGWALNIAQLVHGEEALLAAVLVFALHALHIAPHLLRRSPPPVRTALPPGPPAAAQAPAAASLSDRAQPGHSS